MMHGSGTPVLIDFGWPREDLVARNLHRVLDALRLAGVEVLDDGLRLVPKGKRRSVSAKVLRSRHGECGRLSQVDQLLLAERRRPRRRCRMIILVLNEHRLEGLFWPKLRRADFFQAEGVPI